MKYGKTFYKLVENRLKALFETDFSDNAAFTLAATFACGLTSRAAGPLERVYPFAFAVMILSWITASVSAGFLKQWTYLLYSAAFWLLPNLFIDAAHDPNRTEEFTELNDVLTRVSEIIIYDAQRLFIGTGLDGAAVSQGILIFSLVLFFFGNLARKRARKYRFYCEVRARLLQNSSE